LTALKLSRKTKKQIEGLAGLARVPIERNPVAHAILTAKDISDNAYRLKYGKDPKYRRFAVKPKRRTNYKTPRRLGA
jgi:hypothetical protein